MDASEMRKKRHTFNNIVRPLVPGQVGALVTNIPSAFSCLSFPHEVVLGPPSALLHDPSYVGTTLVTPTVRDNTTDQSKVASAIIQNCSYYNR